MMIPLERPARWSRTDLLVAVIALLFLLAARPILAQSNSNPSTQQGQSYLNPTLNPELNPPMNPGASQSQREADARQNRFNGTVPPTNPQLQPLVECRVEDTACIEQRNRMNPNSPQTAPTFNR